MMVQLEARPREVRIGQALQDLVQVDRIEVPAIYPDVAALGIARQVAVGMPIEMDGAGSTSSSPH
jgi:hypothetical protein